MTSNASTVVPPPHGAPPAARPLARLSPKSVVRGRIAAPLRVLLAGVEGIGKSTFASRAPAPIFLCPENGTEQLDIARLPEPHNWQTVLDYVAALESEEWKEYQTLVLDTVDWLEPLLWKYVCAAASVESIEEVGGGYGKGYTRALDEWRVLLADLEHLRRTRRMNVVLLAHTHIKSFKNPEGSDFDRYTMKLHERGGGLLREWVDVALFANYETFANKDDKTKRVRGVSTGARLIYANRSAAYDAKNRYNLPESLPLDWDEFYAAVQRQTPADPAALRQLCAEKIEKLRAIDTERAAGAAKALEATKADDGARLAQILDKLNGLLVTREA